MLGYSSAKYEAQEKQSTNNSQVAPHGAGQRRAVISAVQQDDRNLAPRVSRVQCVRPFRAACRVPPGAVCRLSYRVQVSRLEQVLVWEPGTLRMLSQYRLCSLLHWSSLHSAEAGKLQVHRQPG